MITSLLVLYAVSALICIASAVLSWYNGLQYRAKVGFSVDFAVSFIPFVNTVWAFFFIVVMTFGKFKDW